MPVVGVKLLFGPGLVPDDFLKNHDQVTGGLSGKSPFACHSFSQTLSVFVWDGVCGVPQAASQAVDLVHLPVRRRPSPPSANVPPRAKTRDLKRLRQNVEVSLESF